MFLKFPTILIVIIFSAALFRFIGLNWDANHHLHPDERFLTMVAGDLNWPTSFSHYLDTSRSPLNPHNAGFNFYVYGTWPVILVKFIAQILGQSDYNHLTLVGRGTSAFFDVGIVLLVFLITHKLTNRIGAALLAAFFYSVSVLPIQLSHFFAVDSPSLFFLTLAFYILIYLISRPALILYIFLGLAFALAVTAKIPAIFFIPIIALGLLYSIRQHRSPLHFILYSVIFVLTFLLALRLSLPYLFAQSSLLTIKLNSLLLDNWQQLKSFEKPDAWFPPAVQWIHTRAFLFPLENLVLWGLGLPLAIISLSSVLFILIRYFRHPILLTVVWIIGLFAYQGFQFTKPLRYFYPIYPFLAITSGVFIFHLLKKIKQPKLFLLGLMIIILIWPLAFVSIYTRPHPRVAASQWLISSLPPGTVLSCEHWDDCLPLGGPGPFRIVELPLYHPDSVSKWTDINARLNQIDYLVLTSNRLYGSITSAPNRYPQTTDFYHKLFSGQLGFTKVAEFTSRPNLPLPGISLCLTPPGISYGAIAYPIQECSLSGMSFVDDYADETFTVYDHPKVIVFKKSTPQN